MIIETKDGKQVEVTGKTQGNLNTFLGGFGSFLGLMNGGANFFGACRGGGYQGAGYPGGYAFADPRANNYAYGDTNPDARFITKGELNLMSKLQEKTDENTRLRTDNAIQLSENYTDKKLVEVTQYLDGKINKLEDKVDINRLHQDEINREQAVYNERATGAIKALRGQIDSLSQITELYVPQSRICKKSCCNCNED